MKKTILITGCSSGIGLETASYFAKKNWNVIATMRNPENRTTPLHGMPNIDLQHLDVTDPASIATTLTYTLEKYRTIDVLLNNAGYALMGPFELTGPDKIKKQFDTNVFGLMEMTKKIIPIFKQQQFGTIINISSIGGRNGVPLYSLYNSTKWAVEGFSEALYYELLPYHIKVKMIEPGFIQTRFNQSQDRVPIETFGDYRNTFARYLQKTETFQGSDPIGVVRAIYAAATSTTNQLRYPAGKLSLPLILLRKLLPERLYLYLINKNYQ